MKPPKDLSKSNRVNPKTGRRYAWEAEQALKAAVEGKAQKIGSELQNIARQQTALDARDNLLTYVKFTMPDPAAPGDITRSRYRDKPFHRAIARALEQVERGEITQLIFCCPPRHGKTELATKRMAAWYSGRHPTHDIAVASYSDTMAEDFGADTRWILNSPQHKQVFPAYRLRRGGAAKHNIQNDQGGRLFFVGRGGALTGRGMHLGLGDDLFKDHEEARSQAIRDQAWNWFTKVFMTRRMGPKLIILTMTRWHSDDIIGRITDKENPHFNATEAAKWKIIKLPAIAEDNDPAGRAPNEPLWPEDFGLDFLESQQRLDPLGFAALYQQSPTVADGTYFRRENLEPYRYRLEDLPKDLRYYCASDHAVGTRQRNDPSCFGKIGIDAQNNIYVLEAFWERASADRAVEAMLEMGRGDRKPLIWFAEKGHISSSIGPFLFKRMQETGTYIAVREIVPKQDKVQRAQSIIARSAMGKLKFPKGLAWADRAIEELLAFDAGLHDDFVDMLSLFGLGLGSQFGATIPAPEKKRPQFGTLAWVKEHDKWAAEKKREAVLGGF